MKIGFNRENRLMKKKFVCIICVLHVAQITTQSYNNSNKLIEQIIVLCVYAGSVWVEKACVRILSVV